MKVLLVGCGNMGSAMLAGWLKTPSISHVDVIDPVFKAVDPRVHVYADASTLSVLSYDMVVLAVKPQIMESVCATLTSKIQNDVPVLSIAAGIPLTKLAKHFGDARMIIRAMPNLPGSIGQGITAFCTNGKTNQNQIDAANILLSALGEAVQIDNEALMDAVTALSGSGPAYVFALTEVLAKAGTTLGLPFDLAQKLARQTVIGSSNLMAQNPEKPAENLRKNVTSPGGTTQAALDVLLENQRLETLFEEALDAAAKRSRDLAQSQ